MIPSLRLGVRLAGAGAAAGSARRRSAMVALAAAVGTVLLLVTMAIARSESLQSSGASTADAGGLRLLLTSVVLTIALPVIVLAAAAGRLSAGLRDRRLANLRLLGMTEFQTRLVAAIETGVAAGAGSLVGLGAFFPVRAALGAWHPADRPWSYATLEPGAAGYLVIVIAVPLVVTVVSASTRGGHARQRLLQSRGSDARRPGWWRLVPLIGGIALAGYLVDAATDVGYSADLIPLMFTAIALLGLGVILVVPSLVRLVADLLVRFRGRPALVIAGRRLQAQPAAATRVVAGLLIGLFVVTGARMVVVAFEQTPQYRTAAMIDTTGQIGTLYAGPAETPDLLARLAATDGIRATAAFPELWQPCSASSDPATSCWGVNAYVGSCADLRAVLGELPDCRDDRAAWIGARPALADSGPLAFAAVTDAGQVSDAAGSDAPAPPTVSVEAPTAVLGGHDLAAGDLGGALFLPASLPGVDAVAATAQVAVVAVAQPGVPILPLLSDAAPSRGFMAPGMEDYDYVASLRMLVWTIAAVVLAVGLLGFAIGAVDRAISRRSEVVSLQLVGTGAGVLRRTQWIEAALPLASGIVLAIAAGSLAGASYLAYGGEVRHLPWGEIGTLTLIALAAAVVVAGITVIASSPRIRPELIRTE